MLQINAYCDESNHLENSPINQMVLGSIYCPKEKVREIHTRIKEIKNKHGLKNNFELKWTKISKAKLQVYLDLVDYFFDSNDIRFRGVVIDKSQLQHAKFGQTHDQWYYKMYFELLSKILEPTNEYIIYIDIKDTQGKNKVDKLHEVLCNNMYDFEKKIIKRVMQVRSHEVGLVQLVDLLIGGLQFANRPDVKSEAKKLIVDRIKKRSGYTLKQSTLFREPKFNIFHWKGEISNAG